MKNEFKFSVLKYVHSRVLQEELIVGVLFYFPHKSRFEFKFPEKLGRLKGLYTNFSESLIKSYLKTFDEKAKEINKYYISQNIDNLDSFIEKEFLLKDSTALEFSKTKAGFLYTENLEQITNDILSIYLSNYFSEQKTTERHNERFLLKKIKDNFISFNINPEKYLIKDKIIEAENGYVKVEYAWQNGSTNLIKPISFDFSDPSQINKTALLNYGYLNFLKNKAQEDNLRFDLFVSRPIEKGLFQAYEKALKVLDSTETPKKIIEEDCIEKYTLEAANYLKSKE